MLGLRLLQKRVGLASSFPSLSTSSIGSIRGSSVHSVLDLKGRPFQNIFSRFPSPDRSTLYDKNNEKDSCGVGLVANMKKSASRQIVLDANQMLVRMSHRGGCGCEVNTGDGAGKQYMIHYTIFT